MNKAKTALVTGGNRGIGLTIVAGLAKQGDIQGQDCWNVSSS